MRKVLSAVALIAIVAYFVNSHIQERTRREAERAEAEREAERIEQLTRLNVSEMIVRTNSSDDWEEILSQGEKFRSTPILTVELERLWLQHRPILFVGAIKDIATHDDAHYRLTIERSLFSSIEYIFDTELQLSLLADIDQIDQFLSEYPELFKDYGFNNGVAVAALLESIETVRYPGEEGQIWEAKVGHGEVVEMLYTGDVFF